MVILNLKLNNILSFSDFEINFSYPRKLKQSIIENEALSSIPNFRYKKLNIFMGSNACGKTSLIRSIWNTLIFLSQKEKNYLERIVNFNEDNSLIDLDCVIERAGEVPTLYRIKIKTENIVGDLKIQVAYKKIALSKVDSYEICKGALDNAEYIYADYVRVLDDIDFKGIGWNVMLPATETEFAKIQFPEFFNVDEKKDYLKILDAVLCTLDSSIDEVTESKDADNAYVIKHKSAGVIIVQKDNNLASIPCLSSGTKYGFNIANIFFSIKFHRNGIYLIDEQFSYIDSDIEKAIISKLVAMLGDNEQLFITTHNQNIASMSFPMHSFYFLKKEDYDDTQIVVNCASEIENRNNVLPKTIIDNDLFGIAPDLNKIFDIEG